MAISARPSTMSLEAAACVVMLFLAQAVLEVNAMRPMLAPTSAPMYAPESAPMYAPEMAPMAPPGLLRISLSVLCKTPLSQCGL
jgi:hypothetical protein